MHKKNITGLGLILPILLSMTSLSSAAGLLDPAQNDLTGGAAAAVSASTVRSAAPGFLVPFQEPSDALTLNGEDDGLELNFAVTPAQIAAGGSIQIGYQNAVSVLPDQSALDVELNGKSIGSFAIRSPNGVAVEKLAVSAADLKPGRNKLFLRARQIHRVDCSMEATYELWTRIDAKVSGFSSAVATGFSSVSDLSGIGKTPEGKTDFRLVFPDAVTAQQLNDALPLVQIMALYLNRTDVAVTVANEPGRGPGIDFYIGSEQSGLPHEKGMQAFAKAPSGLTVQQGASADRAVVFLKAASSDELRAVLLKDVRGAMNEGFKTGLFAPAFGKFIAESGRTFKLSDAGYRTRPFAGRLSHTHFKIEMPADFYSGDYATVDLDLHAATSPGLDPNSQLLVRINDKVVTSYPFRNTNGEQFDGKRVEMPLRAFHPGVNTIDILAEVPKASDSVCAIDGAATAKPRFLLLDNTSITIPKLARVARLPDLAALSGKAYPFRNGKPFNLFVERPDAINLGAVYTFLTRLGMASGNPMNAKFNLSAPDPLAKGDIMVIASQVPSKSGDGAKTPDLGTLGLDGTKTSGIPGEAPELVEAGDSNPEALLQAFQQSTAGDVGAGADSSSVSRFLAYASGRFAKWLRYDEGSSSTALPESGNSLVTLTQMQAPSGEGTWTVLAASTSVDLAAGTNRLAEDTVWTALNGSTAMVHAEDKSLETIPAGNRFIAEFTDVSLGNDRRLAAAWFSDNFQIYVLLVLGLMGGFALWLGGYVPKKGVRTDQ